jgi:hypothetical protein
MGGVDHELVRLSTLGSQSSEDAVEHAEPAPADEPVIDGLVRAIRRRRIAPARITKMIPLMIRRSSTRGTPCDSGKYGSIRRI